MLCGTVWVHQLYMHLYSADLVVSLPGGIVCCTKYGYVPGGGAVSASARWCRIVLPSLRHRHRDLCRRWCCMELSSVVPYGSVPAVMLYGAKLGGAVWFCGRWCCMVLYGCMVLWAVVPSGRAAPAPGWSGSSLKRDSHRVRNGP